MTGHDEAGHFKGSVLKGRTNLLLAWGRKKRCKEKGGDENYIVPALEGDESRGKKRRMKKKKE